MKCVWIKYYRIIIIAARVNAPHDTVPGANVYLCAKTKILPSSWMSTTEICNLSGADIGIFWKTEIGHGIRYNFIYYTTSSVICARHQDFWFVTEWFPRTFSTEVHAWVLKWKPFSLEFLHRMSSECIRPIFHIAPLCNRNVHTCAHFCYKNWKWCNVGDLSGVLWDLWDGIIIVWSCNPHPQL